MVKTSLCEFADRVLAKRQIDRGDIAQLLRSVLADGVTCREEADVLLALDRTLKPDDPAWTDYLVSAIVDFVVWVSRPTGYVDAGMARWLTTSLACGDGPTAAASRIAFEIVNEAQQVDESLIAFLMHAAPRRPRTHRSDRTVPADAAA